MKSSTSPGRQCGRHHAPRTREKIDRSQPVYRCMFCGQETNRMEQFCAACVRDGFDNVYQLRRRDNGWRWREAWAKSHPNPVKYVDPQEGLAMWRQEHFYEEISPYARDHFAPLKRESN